MSSSFEDCAETDCTCSASRPSRLAMVELQLERCIVAFTGSVNYVLLITVE